MEATQKKNKYEIDMCNGTIMDKLISFALPLMVSSILQLLFNAVDIIVVGRFTGSQALAAVGSTTALINMFVNLFIGVSLGANVLSARFYAAGKEREMSETVHTAMTFALISGIVMVFVGLFCTRGALELMDTPADVIDQAALYMKIYFLGMPGTLVYNFGSAILRAVGDTRRPLYFLLTAGVVNVIFNLIFVIAFSMDVAGVGWATVISQYISAALVLRCLIQTEADYRLELSKLRVVKHKLCAIIQIGLPAGLQGAIFSISNVLIQSSINSFGSVAMAGSTASSNIEGFVYTAMNAIYQTALSFTSQNYGAGNFKRIKKIQIYCVAFVVATGLVLGQGAVFFGNELLRIYSSDPEVITYGLERLAIISGPYFLCGIMDVMVGGLRGLGSSVIPMFVSLTGACVFRVIWIYTIFAMNRTLDVLYYSYPVSWLITLTAHVITYVIIFRLRSRNQANVVGSSVAG